MKTLKILAVSSSLVVMSIFATPSYSQCSMCRAVAESGVKDEATKVGRGLNSGILYLLSTPYILGGVAFFIWRKNRKKDQQVA